MDYESLRVPLEILEGMRLPPPETERATPYEALIVLGKNWHERWTLPKHPIEGTELMLSEDSMRSTIAGAELFLQGKTKKLIFSTGHTIGEDYPSEAQAMLDYMRNFYTEEEIPNEVVELEEISDSTPTNAEQVRERGITDGAIVTVDFHMRRSKRLFKNWGVIKSHKDSFVAEDVLRARGFELKKRGVLKKMKEAAVETPQQILLYFNPSGSIANKLTSRIRG